MKIGTGKRGKYGVIQKPDSLIPVDDVHSLTRCSDKWLAAGAGGYGYHLKKQKDRVEKDFQEERIDVNEYRMRTDQLNRDALLKQKETVPPAGNDHVPARR